MLSAINLAISSNQQNKTFKKVATKSNKNSVSFGYLPLETQIMNRVGLVGRYDFFNGSSSCQCIRIMAANRLSDAINTFAEKENKIIPSDEKIIDMIKKIAVSPHQDTFNKGNYDEVCLTKTWDAVLDAIKIHMKAFNMQGEKREQYLQTCAKDLKQKYMCNK